MRKMRRLTPMIIAFGAFPLVASAQLLPPVGIQQLPQAGAAATQEGDVLSLDAGIGVEHHSNFLLLPDGVAPGALGSKSETLVRGVVGVTFDRVISLQRIRLDAQILPTKFLENSRFDYLGYNLGAAWTFQIGRPWFGEVSTRLRRELSNFEYVLTDRQNLEDRRLVRAAGGFRFTPSWAALAGVEYEYLDNNALQRRDADYRYKTAEVGARYAPGTGAEVDLVYRRTDGDYPNRQVFDAAGNVLPGGVDNAFTQDQVLARLQYRPNEESRIAGAAGYTRREFDRVSGRDFSGPTARVEVDWSPTGAFLMRTSLSRDIYSEETLTASYVDATTLALRPLLRLTGKISLGGNLVYSQRDYEGDPGFVLGGSAVRKDDFHSLGLQLQYEYARNILMTAEVRRDRRDSNFNQFDYKNNVVSAGIRARF